MPFVFNPFINNFDEVDTNIPAPGTLDTLSGNDGITVGPTAGNISILGAGGNYITGDALTSTLTVTGALGVHTWSLVAASQTMAVNVGYAVTGGGSINLEIPVSVVNGDMMIIAGTGANLFVITQPGGLSIRFGTLTTTVGVGGSITALTAGATLCLVNSGAGYQVLWSSGDFDVV